LKKYSIILVIVAVQCVFADGFKKYAAEFLYNGVGSRALAMGSAFVGVANDVTAGFWNPAGLVEAPGLQMQFMHAKQFVSSIQYDYLAASLNMDSRTAYALSVIRLGVNYIKDTRNALRGESIAEGLDPSRISQFNTADYAFYLSYARRLSEKFDYGANVKVLYRDYAFESALGLGFDAAIRYHISNRFTMGLIARDITTTMMAWTTGEKEFITPALRPGFTYRFDFDKIGLYIQPAMDVNMLFESRASAAQFHLGPVSLDTFWGMEIGFKNITFLRFGYDDLNRFSAGIGLSITRLAVDYSYTNYDRELGNVHRISFQLKLPSI
jgi:hypothetical protein